MKLFLASLLVTSARVVISSEDICLGSRCTEAEGKKVCSFNFKVDLEASELGYYTVEGCKGVMPTLGIEKHVTYMFSQEDETNYYHPLGFAYYADGAHDDVDELEPGIAPPGSKSRCDTSLTCPAPMYLKGGKYLGEYSNNELIAPLQDSENFGLDDYEPEFFLDTLTWNTAGKYEIALNFDIEDFTQDIFYFCHIHQFMTGRIKFIDENGTPLQKSDIPEIPYEYDTLSEYDQSCGTYGLDKFQLPHNECPSMFVCGKPGGAVGAFAGCLDSMNCAMTVGMTTNVNMGSAIALFNHQMIPHHQNAVNMCKSLMKSGELVCKDITNEEDPHCQMTRMCYEIINGQNFQIQLMRGVNEALGYDKTDDCYVPIGTELPCKSNESSKKGKSGKKSKSSTSANSPRHHSWS